MRKKNTLNEQGVSLNTLKLNILSGKIDKNVAKTVATAFSKEISKALLDNELLLTDFDLLIRSKKEYLLTEQEILEQEINEIITMYDNELTKRGCEKFLLDYRVKQDIIYIKRMIRINKSYFKNFFGITEEIKSLPKSALPSCKKPVNTISEQNSMIDKMNFFYPIFIEEKLKQVAKAIKAECNNTFIKPTSRGINISYYYEKNNAKIDIYLSIDRKVLKSFKGNIDRMEQFLKASSVIEYRYLQPHLYK